jgi:hypothetical protein
LIEKAAIIFGESFEMQVNYINEKISRDEFPQWEIQIWKDKNLSDFG